MNHITVKLTQDQATTLKHLLETNRTLTGNESNKAFLTRIINKLAKAKIS